VEQEQLATIGKVIGTHGVKGGLKVLPYSDFPERVKELTRLFFEKNGHLIKMNVNDAFLHGRFWVISLEGVNNLEEADIFIGMMVQIPLDERHSLPADTYYFDEILGLDVYSIDGTYLGQLSEVLQTGSNDVYVVRLPGEKREVLIPALKKVVQTIDFQEKRMFVKLPEGLL